MRKIIDTMTYPVILSMSNKIKIIGYFSSELCFSCKPFNGVEYQIEQLIIQGIDAYLKSRVVITIVFISR